MKTSEAVAKAMAEVMEIIEDQFTFEEFMAWLNNQMKQKEAE